MLYSFFLGWEKPHDVRALANPYSQQVTLSPTSPCWLLSSCPWPLLKHFFALLWLFLLTHPLKVGISLSFVQALFASHSTHIPVRSPLLLWLQFTYRQRMPKSLGPFRTSKSCGQSWNDHLSFPNPPENSPSLSFLSVNILISHQVVWWQFLKSFLTSSF